ncbi:MAG: MFS transporter [Candidatus Promineofilum sp.]|nr:MFS transporter [Promineifilum sp.]
MTILFAARQRYTMLLAFSCFVAQGIISGMLGVAWPSIRATFGLSLDALVALLIASTIGYVLGSFLASPLLARIGVGWALLVTNLVSAAGFFGFVLAPSWAGLVAFGLLTGWGGGTTGTVLNIYVASTRTVRTMNWMHASFGVGATIGPLLMTAIVGAGASWRLGYAIGAFIHLGLGLLFLTVVRTMTFRGIDNATAEDPSAHAAPIRATLRLPMVWLSILLFLLYTGVESTAGQWTYTWFTESRAASAYLAGAMTSVFWAMLTVGRVVFGAGAARIGVTRLLRLSMIGTVLAAALLLVRSLPVGFVAIALMGLSLSAIFPTLTADAPRRVGARHAGNVIGLQTGAASIGLAVLPGLAGAIAARVGLEALGPFLVGAALLMLLVNQVAMVTMRRQEEVALETAAGD